MGDAAVIRGEAAEVDRIKAAMRNSLVRLAPSTRRCGETVV
jgi:hypothetical protein